MAQSGCYFRHVVKAVVANRLHYHTSHSYKSLSVRDILFRQLPIANIAEYISFAAMLISRCSEVAQ
jgi:hypothetical protein